MLIDNFVTKLFFFLKKKEIGVVIIENRESNEMLKWN